MTALEVLPIGTKLVKCDFPLIYFRRQFQEIGIAAFLLGIKPHHAEKFRQCRLSEVGESALRNEIRLS